MSLSHQPSTPTTWSWTAGRNAEPPLRGAAGAAEAAGWPARVRVLGRVEDKTAIAAGCPAGAADGPRPGMACDHVRPALLDQFGAICARAAVPVRIVAGGVVDPARVGAGTGGVKHEPSVRGRDPPPGEWVSFAVADARLDWVVGWRPRLGWLFGDVGVTHAAESEGGGAEEARSWWRGEGGARAAVGRELAGWAGLLWCWGVAGVAFTRGAVGAAAVFRERCPGGRRRGRGAGAPGAVAVCVALVACREGSRARWRRRRPRRAACGESSRHRGQWRRVA